MKNTKLKFDKRFIVNLSKASTAVMTTSALLSTPVLLTPDVKEVCIVESEKPAVMMSVFDARGRTYLATGGSGNLNNLCEKAVKRGLFLHKKVILIPDNGQAKNWQKTALKYGFIVENICENCSEVGCDILDLNEWIRKEPKKILNDEKIKRLLDNLNK